MYAAAHQNAKAVDPSQDRRPRIGDQIFTAPIDWSVSGLQSFSPQQVKMSAQTSTISHFSSSVQLSHFDPVQYGVPMSEREHDAELQLVGSHAASLSQVSSSDHSPSLSQNWRTAPLHLRSPDLPQETAGGVDWPTGPVGVWVGVVAGGGGAGALSSGL